MIDTNPVNSKEYEGILGKLKYKRKFHFNSLYRWADIYRDLDDAGVPRWSRKDEKEFVKEGTDEHNKKLRHLVHRRDIPVAVTGISGSLLCAWRYSIMQRVIPAFPFGFLYSPIFYMISYLAVDQFYGSYKYDDMNTWETFSQWYINKNKKDA